MKNRTHFLLLLLALALGFWLRVDSADWALPFRLHPDEWKYVRGAANVHQGVWNPKYFRNPPGFTYLSAAWYPLWLQIGPRPRVPAWFTTQYSVVYPEKDVVRTYYYRPFDLVLGSRWLAAIMGTLTIFLIYWIAHEFKLEAPVPVFAAVLCAVSFAGVRESHFAVNDTAMAFWTTLAVGMGIRALRINSSQLYMLAGALCGVAIAFKYSAFPALFVILTLRCLPYFKIGILSTKPTKALRDAAAAAGLCVACFLIICPFPILDSSTFFAEMEKLSNAASAGWPGQEKVWSGFLFTESWLTSEGVMGVMFALTGAVVLIAQQKWPVLLFPAAYAILLCSHPLYFMRFSLPFLPWAALAAAVGIQWACERLMWEKAKPTALLIVLGLCVLQPLAYGLRGNYLLKQPDPRVEALRWLKSQQDSFLIASDQYGFPLSYWGTAEVWSKSVDPRIVVIDPLPSNELKQLDTISEIPTSYVAVSTFAAFPGKIPDSYQERKSALLRYAGNPHGAAERFLVFDENSSAYNNGFQAADVEDTYSPVTNLWMRTRSGPAIEIFPVKK